VYRDPGQQRCGDPGKYHLPYRAAVSGEYRFFTDDWGIDAHTIEVGYVHPFREKWLFDFRYRYYTQNAADFYSDLFPYANAQNFLARDKELSTFQSQGPRAGVTYTILDRQGERPLKSTVNTARGLLHVHLRRLPRPARRRDAGTEPFYDFDATVVQLFFSLWF
jgi:hypothetical protein